MPRPKQDISLPYKHYRLVTSDGKALERQDKHPFCMSRVYYSRDERPQEAWAEDSGACYRWRQSSSEIKLIALKASQTELINIEMLKLSLLSYPGAKLIFQPWSNLVIVCLVELPEKLQDSLLRKAKI